MVRGPVKICSRWKLCLAITTIVMGNAESARGAEGILEAIVEAFSGDGNLPGVRNVALEDQFRPVLKKMLSVEIYFARKVCQPDEQQLTALRQAGNAEVSAIAKEYAALQQKRRSPSEWPDPRQRFVDVLTSKIQQTMPAEAHQRYVLESTARLRARDEAALGLMMTVIDSKLWLTDKQYEQIRSSVREKWNAKWSRNSQVFYYEEYAPRPSLEVINPHLTDPQREVWNSMPNNGGISFGWPQDAAGWPDQEGEVGNEADLWDEAPPEKAP